MKHLIKIESAAHGVLGVRHVGRDQQYCEVGEQVILDWQPDAKWGLQEAHYTDGDGNVTPIDLTPVKVNGKDEVVFTMPDADIFVCGTFKRFVVQDWTDGEANANAEVFVKGGNGEPVAVSVDEFANTIAGGDNELADATESILDLKLKKISVPLYEGKSVNSSGEVITSSYFNVYQLKVNRGDLVSVILSCSTSPAAIGFSSSPNALSGINVIQCGVNTSAAESSLRTYFCHAHDDGYFYFVSDVIPEYRVVGTAVYENDDSYYTSKFRNQETIHPDLGAVTAYGTGCAVNFASTTRILFKLYIKAGTTSYFTLHNPNSLNLSYHNRAAYAEGNHTNYSTWTTSFSDGVLSVTNPTVKDGYVLVTLKKSDNSEFTVSDLSGLYLTRNTEGISISGGNAEFVATMNRYATRLGMSSSSFVNSYGGLRDGVNSSCVADILKMSINAWGYEKIRNYMSVNSVNVSVYGTNARTETITNSTQSTMDSYYTAMKTAGQVPSDFPSTNPFILLGRKGGGWSSGTYKAFSLVAFTLIDGKLVCGVTATNNPDYDGTTGREARVKGMIELFCIATKIIRNESTTGMDTTFVEKATVAIVPDYCGCYTNIAITPLWSKNPTDAYNPASTTKILAGMVMLDTLPNLQEYHQITTDELENDSSYTAYAGDVETVDTSFYAMFLASNGTNTISLAKMAGTKMLESKNKFI